MMKIIILYCQIVWIVQSTWFHLFRLVFLLDQWLLCSQLHFKRKIRQMTNHNFLQKASLLHRNNHFLHLNLQNREGSFQQLIWEGKPFSTLSINQPWLNSVCQSLRMKVAVLGATGQTGQYLVNQALQQGHTVTAIVRNPGKLTIHHDNLKVM